MKKVIFFLMAPLLVAILFVPASSQDDMEVVDDWGFEKKQHPPAIFPHNGHNESAEIEDCRECHHIYEDGRKLEDESSEDLSCCECHDEEGSDGRPGLRKAFHVNCKGCHLERNTGPVMCGECHVR